MSHFGVLWYFYLFILLLNNWWWSYLDTRCIFKASTWSGLIVSKLPLYVTPHRELTSSGAMWYIHRFKCHLYGNESSVVDPELSLEVLDLECFFCLIRKLLSTLPYQQQPQSPELWEYLIFVFFITTDCRIIYDFKQNYFSVMHCRETRLNQSEWGIFI